jgi:acyl transferase domain-containing protein
LPSSLSPDEFWANLANEKDCLIRYTKKELLDAGVPTELLEDPLYVKAKGTLEDVEYFDSKFFGYTPKQAETIDPQVQLSS